MHYFSDTHKKGFSIIEVLIGIFVFSLGLVSIFALLSSSLSVNEYSKNSIIASNLAREQIELIRNIRDTNYKNLKLWNQHNPDLSLSSSDITDPTKVFLYDHHYTLENNPMLGDIEVSHLGTDILQGPEYISTMAQDYGLCLNVYNFYSYDCSGGNLPVNFYRYISVREARDASGNILDDAMIITSKVIWYKRGYHEYEIETIITDWRRI